MNKMQEKTTENESKIKAELKKLGYWNEIYKNEDAFGTGPTKLALLIHEVMKKRKIKKILELGCGQGRDSLFFAQQNYSVTATDLSLRAVEFVNQKAKEENLTNLETFVFDLRKKPNFHQEFDCIYSNLAFQFFNKLELKEIFSNLSRCLKKGNLFIFSTKKPGDKYYKVGERIIEQGYKKNGITRYFFEKQELHELLSDFFKVEEIGEDSHINFDNSVSRWWYIITQKI